MTLSPIPRSHLLRDAGVVAATLLLWAADSALRAAPGALAAGVACLAGALTGLAAYVAHEWGHFLGARLSGSVVRLPSTARAVFLFQFDRDANSRRQFLAMSLGGFAASAAVVTLLLRTLPLSALSGRVALGLTALGVLAAVITEVPVFWRVLRGGPIPRGAAYVEAGGGSAA